MIEKKDLTYEIICDAVNGNDEAEEFIFDYYEPYIVKLSKVPFINKRGQVSYIIDEDILNRSNASALLAKSRACDRLQPRREH